MAGKVFADASFLISLVIDSHPFRLKAEAIFSKYKRFVISAFVLEEVVHVLRRVYHLDFDELENFVVDVLTLEKYEFIEAPNEKMLLAKLVNCMRESHLGTRDAIHYLFMRTRKLRLLATFDGDFIQKQKELRIKVV